jgi:phage virion morphogenesis protein
MTASVSIRDDRVQSALARVAELGGSRREALMADIAGQMLTSTQQRFEREVGPDGRPWARLRPRTIAERRAKGYVPIRILRRRVSPGLYGSITADSDASSAAVGTNRVYAGVHQGGDTITRYARSTSVYRRYDAKTGEVSPRFVKKSTSNFAQRVTIGEHTITIPARPYLGFDDADRREIEAIVGLHATRAIEGGP